MGQKGCRQVFGGGWRNWCNLGSSRRGKTTAILAVVLDGPVLEDKHCKLAAQPGQDTVKEMGAVWGRVCGRQGGLGEAGAGEGGSLGRDGNAEEMRRTSAWGILMRWAVFGEKFSLFLNPPLPRQIGPLPHLIPSVHCPL